MQMTDSQRIPASREAVWAALNDPEVLKRCIPGCESLEKTSPTDMTASVVLKVGPVKAKFGGKVTLSDLDPPNGYRISGEGSGGVAGFAKGGATVKLDEDGPDATLLHYEVDAQIGGKLAQLGGRLIDSTAKKLAGEFFESFAAALAPPAPEAAAGAPAGAGTEEGAPDASPDAAPDAASAGSEADQGKKKGWFGGLFSGSGATSSAVALLAAGLLSAHACCLYHGHTPQDVASGFPICRGIAS